MLRVKMRILTLNTALSTTKWKTVKVVHHTGYVAATRDGALLPGMVPHRTATPPV